MPTFKLSDPTRFIDNQGNRESELRRNKNTILGEIGSQSARGFTDIANEGIFGQQGIADITAAQNKASSARRSAFSESFKRRGSRGVGPRSGSVNTFVANKFLAPEFLQQSQNAANLTKENLLSKISGLQGLMSTADIFKLIEDEEQGGGALDMILGLGSAGVDIASIPGIGGFFKNLLGRGDKKPQNFV